MELRSLTQSCLGDGVLVSNTTLSAAEVPFLFQGGKGWGWCGRPPCPPLPVPWAVVGTSRLEELSPCPRCCRVTARWQPRPALGSLQPKAALRVWEGEELKKILLGGQHPHARLALPQSPLLAWGTASPAAAWRSNWGVWGWVSLLLSVGCPERLGMGRCLWGSGRGGSVDTGSMCAEREQANLWEGASKC